MSWLVPKTNEIQDICGYAEDNAWILQKTVYVPFATALIESGAELRIVPGMHGYTERFQKYVEII